MDFRLIASFASLLLLSLSCTSSAPSRAATQPVIAAPTRPTAEIATAARKDLYWLAADAREGRSVGTQGLEEAGAFIANRFKSLGLLPLPATGSYFQPFDFDAGKKIGSDTSLSVNGTPLAPADFTGFTQAKPDSVTGSLAFVGYATQSPAHDYDDFADIDVKGKVVLAMRWEPHNAEGKSQWDERGEWSSNSQLQRKADRAARAGAAALLLVNAPIHHDDADRLLPARGGFRRAAPLPVFHLSVDAVNQLLEPTGTNLAELQKQIDETSKPASRTFGNVTVDATLQLEKETAGVRNVVAFLPGTGPHAEEYIVIGAHYDHVGRGAFGSTFGSGPIHNGADDNGSGTTTLLQLANEFALAGRQKRSLIFVAFTLEEVGLIGSQRFVENLPVPKDKVVAMVNLDMVGRMKNQFVYVGGGGTTDAFGSILESADTRSPIELLSMGQGGKGPSDHQNFANQRIPSLFFFTGMHADYHAPGDDVDKINYDGIAQLVHLTFDVVQQICAMERGAYVDKYDGVMPDTEVASGERPTIRQPAVIVRTRVQIGIVPSPDESAKGIRFDEVTAVLPAAAAGFKAGDVLVQLNDQTIESIVDLRSFLEAAQPGDVVKATVLRGEERVTADITLTARGR